MTDLIEIARISGPHGLKGKIKIIPFGDSFQRFLSYSHLIIGKNGSMLEVLRRGTNSNFVVGRNGRVWAKGGNTQLLFKAIKKIEDEAHLSNLTNKMSDFLLKEKGI